MHKQVRQGDIFFEKTDKKPSHDMVKKDDNVVAYGEVTGHKHKFLDAKVWYFSETPTIGRLVEVEAPTKIEHQEHKPIPFEPATYVVTHQRIFSDIGFRKVLD